MNQLKRVFNSAYYSKYVVVAGDNEQVSDIVFTDLNHLTRNILKIAVNSIEANPVNINNVLSIYGPFKKDDVIELYVPYADSKDLEIKNVSGTIPLDFDSLQVSRLFGALCDIRVSQSDKVYGSSEVSKQRLYNELMGLLKSPLTTGKHEYSGLISKDAEFGVFADLMSNGDFQMLIEQGLKPANDCSFIVGRSGFFYGNAYGAFTRVVKKGGENSLYSSLKPVVVNLDGWNTNKRFKKILFKYTNKDIQFKDNEIVSFVPGVKDVSLQDKRELERIIIPADFLGEKLGCFQEIPTFRMTLIEPSNRPYLEYTPLPTFKKTDKRVPTLETNFNVGYAFEEIAGDKTFETFLAKDVAPAPFVNGRLHLFEMRNSHIKFVLGPSNNTELDKDEMNGNMFRTVRAKYPWLYDIRTSLISGVSSVSLFNVLFLCVNKSIEKTKAVLAEGLENAVPSRHRIKCFLLNRKWETELTIDDNGVFNISTAYPDGRYVFNNEIFFERAFFTDSEGVFQVINGSPNPRYSNESKLLWVDVMMKISNDDVRDVYKQPIRFDEELKIVVFSTEPITIEKGDLPASISLKTPFDGSMLSYDENFNVTPRPVNTLLFALGSLNHYAFECSFKDKTAFFPLYNLQHDNPISEDSDMLTDLEIVETGGVKYLNVKISDKVGVKFNVSLYSDKKIFKGGVSEVSLFFDRENPPWRVELDLSRVQANEKFKVFGVLRGLLKGTV